MGKNQLAMLRFAIAYAGWHSYAKNRATTDAVKSLEQLGLIEVNKFHQFRLMLRKNIVHQFAENYCEA